MAGSGDALVQLAPFLIPAMAADKKIVWRNFIVGKMGVGPNQLAIEQALSPNTFKVYLAMPTATYERYVAKGRSEGFEVVREGVENPVPRRGDPAPDHGARGWSWPSMSASRSSAWRSASRSIRPPSRGSGWATSPCPQRRRGRRGGRRHLADAAVR